MNIRPSLMPPAHDRATVERLLEIVRRALDSLQSGADYAPLVQQFNAETGQLYDIEDFEAAFLTMDLRDLVHIALDRPPAGVVATDAELEEIIGLVVGGGLGDRDIHYWLTMLDRQLPHPAISDVVVPGRRESPAAILAEARAGRSARLYERV